MILPPFSRFIYFNYAILTFLRYIFVAIKKFIKIFSQLYTKGINYVDMIPFVTLYDPYFDNFMSVNKECQLKFVAPVFF